MGVTASTSLSKLGDNAALKKFVGVTPIPDGDPFWKELLTFSYVPPKAIGESRILEESARPLVEQLVKNNPLSGNLRTLIKLMLEQAAQLKDESKCESNISTWQVHNALLLTRLSVKHFLEKLSEMEAILQLDGAKTVQQITSLESHTPSLATPSSATETSSLGRNAEASQSSGQPSGVNDSQSSSSGVSAVQGDPGLLPRVTGSDLDSLASQAAGVGESPGEELGSKEMLDKAMNPEEILAMDTLLSKQLVDGLVALLAEVPLLPFTYDVHLQALQLMLVVLSSQMYLHSSSGIFLHHVLSTPRDNSCLLIHALVQHFISQDVLPPQDFRLQSDSLISSITSGLWSLMRPTRPVTVDVTTAPLANLSLLLLLVLTHQNAKGYNPFRDALSSFKDEMEHGSKVEPGSFNVNLEKLYLAICRQLNDEQTTLFLYLLLQGNSNFASFVFSRSDIDQLVVPMLKQLYNCGNHGFHHVYMLLIILLIFSQDTCFNKSVHDIVLSKVPWYTERTVMHISLGSIIVMMLVRTVQVNMAQIRDKYLHTNCLAALANMSSLCHSLHLDASQKIVNLFKMLAKKHQKVSEKMHSSVREPTASSPTTPPQSPLAPEGATPESCAADRAILEEILLMVLEIINSTLSHSLHTNPHLVYSLLYQREIFEPYRAHPSLMHLIQNIETVIVFFSSRLEEKHGPGPYSSALVLEVITQASKSWPRNSLRVFPELKFRYVEEDQPEEFFIPYVWTMVFKASMLYWDNKKIQFST